MTAEERWIQVWAERGTYQATADDRERAYVVSMFAYPSGDLHMGHAEVYSIGDAIARFHRMRGRNVLHPIGWDSFGLPAENAAIKRGLDPREWTYANIATQAESFRRLGVSVEWRSRLHTSDPEFYRWNQWLFLRFFEHGLAYRAEAPVNWCPQDATVLANEQVVGGRCERCGTAVEQRPLTQWFFRTTAYAQRLLDDMALIDWPDEILAMQRNWIGEAPDFRLRDWLVSRQRRWGTPIPIVHCPACGEVPVPDDELPVLVPESLDRGLVSCPACGRPAQRETDTMDTFVDSSWYFLRYPAPEYSEAPFHPEALRRWLPVTDYIGGKEHATGHLIYARFVTKALHDMGLVDFVEPFARLTTQGQVLMDGHAMSKSLGNLVDLREQIDQYGPDAVRLSILFAGPPEDDIDWADVSVTGAVKFLARVVRLAEDIGWAPREAVDNDLRRAAHREVAAITTLMEGRRFNVAIAHLMKLTSALRRAIDDPSAREGAEMLAQMLSCVAPFTAEEVWERLGHGPSVHDHGWPVADPALAARPTTTCVVQVDGKVVERLTVPVDIDETTLLDRVMAVPALAGLVVARSVVRPPRIVNLVVER